MIFKCADGSQKCSRHILYCRSEYYTGQLDAIERFKNKTEFDCTPFSKRCVKTFLDHMHGIEVDGVDLALLLEMIKFIMHLGKSK